MVLADESEHTLEVVTAADGKEALERFRAIDPDLMLLDLMLPSIDGLEVCRRIKADAATRASAVVMVTGTITKARTINTLSKLRNMSFLS